MKRKIDELGRFCIPAKYRNEMEISEGQSVEITVEYGSICIKPFNAESLEERPFVGIVRDIDKMGRVSLPREYRDILRYSKRRLYECEFKNGKLIIRT